MSSSRKPIQTLSDTVNYPNIPQSLIKYTRRCITEGVHNRFTKTLLDKPIITVRAIDRMFENASIITGWSPEDLLRATDFHPNDNDPHRIEAAFAEVRAISFLSNEGFEEIQPLPAKCSKESDFLAKHGSKMFAIEVADSVFDATNRNNPDDLVNWAISRAIDGGKIRQIEATKKVNKCSRGAFVFAIDTQSPTIWLTRPQFVAVAKSVWQKLGARCDLHIGCFTGRVTIGNIPDDVFYPEGSQNLLGCLWKKLRILFGLGI